MKPQSHSLPQLPPRLKAATLAAADTLTAIAHSDGVELTKTNGAAKDPPITILYVLREHIAKLSVRYSSGKLSTKHISLKTALTRIEDEFFLA